MRSTIAIAPILVALSHASPVEKRAGLLVSSTDGDLPIAAGISILAGVPFARPAQTGSLAEVTSIIVPGPTTSGLPAAATPVIRGPVRKSATAEATDDHEDGGDADETGTVLDKRADPVKVRMYSKAAVNRHNVHRANHGSGPVTWSPELAQAAMKSAKRCTFAHFVGENGLNYGQNLAIGSPAQDIAGIITEGWYSEVDYYKGNYGKAQPDYGVNMALFEKWGHFTQVVWKGSTKIGCATWHCKSVKKSATDSSPLPAAYGGDVTYCNYQKPGNYAGQYAANIGKPKVTQNIANGYGVNKTAIALTYSEHTGQNWTAI